MREAGGLVGDPADHLGVRGADAGHGDPGGQVDELVAVDVDDDGTAGVLHEHGKGDAEATGDRGAALLVELPGTWSGDLGPQQAALRGQGGNGGHVLSSGLDVGPTAVGMASPCGVSDRLYGLATAMKTTPTPTTMTADSSTM